MGLVAWQCDFSSPVEKGQGSSGEYSIIESLAGATKVQMRALSSRIENFFFWDFFSHFSMQNFPTGFNFSLSK